MSRPRAHQAPLGFTSNGILLVNVLAQLSEAQAATLRAALPTQFGGDWFIGFAVDGTKARAALTRLDDAAAEAAARLVGAETKGAKGAATSRPKSRVRRRAAKK
ncbi:MAG: hypothetical protein ACOY0T_01965 [Myxococcota bacterium]